VYRYIDQVCFFLREKGQNRIVMVAQDGQLVLRTLPEQICRRLARAGIEEPFTCARLDEELKEGEE
jgi:pilus assembly protein CpaF